ncbi:MAG: lipoprotein insertase outer membrane protein LolB [Legionellales bacterium]|nr:lipoprotein insertase outer membrane protein LolB [Legionellales bacterium]
MTTLKLRFLVCLLSICFITACAPPKLKPEWAIPSQGKSQIKATQPSSITSWEISGAMAAKNQKKAWTASLDWVQSGPEQYQIRLFGPLGGGAVLIEKSKGIVTFLDGPKKVTSHNADELLELQTGIRLPVNDLYYWVRGLPASASTKSTQYDSKGHLTTLSEAGYVIHYLNYSTISNIDLPEKIVLQGHGVVIKLVIKKWSI